MATPSRMLALGTPLPAARLTNVVDGTTVDLTALAEGKRGTLVAFICNHCPYVVHLRKELVGAAHPRQSLPLGLVAITSTDAADYPKNGPEPMARLAKAEKWGFPFLFDASQDVARAFGAECTPDLFPFDAA